MATEAFGPGYIPDEVALSLFREFEHSPPNAFATSDPCGVSVCVVREGYQRHQAWFNLLRSLKKSTGVSIDEVWMYSHASEPPEFFFRLLKASWEFAAHEFITILPCDAYVHPRYLSTCAELLRRPENKQIDFVTADVLYACHDGNGKRQGDAVRMSTQHSDALRTIRSSSPYNRGAANPFNLLHGCVFRRSSLLKFLYDLQLQHFPDNETVEAYVWERLITRSQLRSIQLSTPLVSVWRPNSDGMVERAVELLKGGRASEALPLLEEAADRGCTIANLDYIRAVVKISLQNHWEAARDLERYLAGNPHDMEARALYTDVTAHLPTRIDTFETIRGAVDSVEGFLLPGQEEYLFKKAQEVPDGGLIVEIGSCWGRSTTAMAFACRGTKKRIVCVDTWGTHGYRGARNGGERDIFERNLKRLGLDSYVSIRQGNSWEVLREWAPQEMADLVFIDGSHSYSDARRDFELSFKFTRPGAWILFHDMVPFWAGVWQVWHECAQHALSSHEFCASIAAGRKSTQAGATLSFPKSFDFTREFIAYAKRAMPQYGTLLHALEVDINSPITSPSVIAAEREILGMSGELLHAFKLAATREPVSDGYSEPAVRDGFIPFWYSLTLLREGRVQEARACLASWKCYHGARAAVDVEKRFEQFVSLTHGSTASAQM